MRKSDTFYKKFNGHYAKVSHYFMSRITRRVITVVTAVLLLFIVGGILLTARRPELNIRQAALYLLSPRPDATQASSPQKADEGIEVISESNTSASPSSDTAKIVADQFTGTGGMLLPITVIFGSNTGESITGTATLQDQAGKTVVSIALSGYPRGTALSAAIFTSSCPELGLVKYSLNPVVSGRSQTQIPVGLDQIQTEQPLSIVVRQTVGRAIPTVTCGDIPNTTP